MDSQGYLASCEALSLRITQSTRCNQHLELALCDANRESNRNTCSQVPRTRVKLRIMTLGTQLCGRKDSAWFQGRAGLGRDQGAVNEGGLQSGRK